MSKHSKQIAALAIRLEDHARLVTFTWYREDMLKASRALLEMSCTIARLRKELKEARK